MNIFSEKVNVKKQQEIKDFILNNFDADISDKQYAFWQIKSKDFTAIFYNSGKFVIQGKNIESLMESLTQEFSSPFNNFSSSEQNKKENSLPVTLHSSPYIGTDESGKGDFFGPLVVAGVLLDDKNRQLFINLGIKDSKTIKDEKILEMAKVIQENSVFSIVPIANDKYNELYASFKNLNKLLAWGHARVIENILQKAHALNIECNHALSDKFGDEKLIKNALMEKGQNINLDQRVRAESDIAVAAASVLARAMYVQKMKLLENEYEMTLPKGCSTQVKTAAKNFTSKYGKQRLKEVSKTHFKTYNEI